MSQAESLSRLGCGGPGTGSWRWTSRWGARRCLPGGQFHDVRAAEGVGRDGLLRAVGPGVQPRRAQGHRRRRAAGRWSAWLGPGHSTSRRCWCRWPPPDLFCCSPARSPCVCTLL